VAAEVPEQNVTLEPRALHMEVFDLSTGEVWLQQAPITQEEFAAFKPEPPYVKSGIGKSAMDFAHFTRSPGAKEDGPLETRVIGGRTLARVAKPLDFRGLARGDAPTRLQVNKYHRIGFEAGTRVCLAQLPDGQLYVQQTVAPGPERIAPPADWNMFEFVAPERWWVYLDSPVTVWFFRNLSSFMGPLPRGQLPAELVAKTTEV
jgi:hypothetical protein